MSTLTNTLRFSLLFLFLVHVCAEACSLADIGETTDGTIRYQGFSYGAGQATFRLENGTISDNQGRQGYICSTTGQFLFHTNPPNTDQHFVVKRGYLRHNDLPAFWQCLAPAGGYNIFDRRVKPDCTLLYLAASGDCDIQPLTEGEFSPPLSSDARSPCPVMNTLANHGFMPRDGGDFFPQQAIDAITKGLGFSVEVAANITNSGFQDFGNPKKLNYTTLREHNKIEHDASLSRNDSYFGNDFSIVPARVEKMISFSTDGEYLTPDDVIRYRRVIQAESAKTNPNFKFGPTQQFISGQEAARIFLMFGDFQISINDTISLFLHEHLPPRFQVKDRNQFSARITIPLLTTTGARIVESMCQHDGKCM